MEAAFIPLYKLSWYRISLPLRNSRNIYAKEHPLSIFEGLLKSAANAGAPRIKTPFIFHVRSQTLEVRIHKGHHYPLDIILPAATHETTDAFLENIVQHLQNPRNNFEVIATPTVTRRNLETLEQEAGPLPAGCEELCLHFHTPFPFTPQVKNRRWLIDKDQFVRILMQRLTELSGLPPAILASMWESINIVPYYWEYVEFGHKPKSNPGKSEYINGTVGPLFLKGAVHGVYPALLILAELHAGRKAAKGRGYYTLSADPVHFDQHLNEVRTYEAAWEALERDSDMAQSFSETFLNKERAINKLRNEIVEKRYQPDPFRGFFVGKKSGGRRIVAACTARDHLVHKVLFNMLAPIMERMFENCSVGFRRGRSRETAREMIVDACQKGYGYILESDIASFFDQINWDILLDKLSGCIPSSDRILRAVVERCIKAPLEVGGTPIERTEGLIQGSPLSPLLANLYLDTFDEAMESRGFYLVRYGDDFLVLTRSMEEARQALEDAQGFLNPLKLSLKAEKTAIKPVDVGFTFLGLDFGPQLDEAFVEKTALRKTLFIQNQYAFIGVDGDAVIIRRGGDLISRLPIKRIGEIVVCGNNTVSARFLHKCSRERIPVSFCSPAGYYINTLRPDSKRHFLTAARHANCFEALGEGGRLAVARKIITAKIANYLAWISRFSDDHGRATRHRLEACLGALAETASIQQLLGYEGDAARAMFRFGNDMVKVPDFRATARLPFRKPDHYNALLDFAYSLLFSRINVLLRSQGLNPYLGFLHSHKDHFESLAADLQEPFRCRMDRLVIKLINRKVIQFGDFSKSNNGAKRLEGPAVGRFLEAFERECAIRLRGEGGTLQQLLVAQVRVVENWVCKGGEMFFYAAKR